jgi:hypothetical protein
MKSKTLRKLSFLAIALLVCTMFAAFNPVKAAPSYSSLAISSTGAGTSCTFYATFNDSAALNPNGQVTFGTNNTGAWFWSSPQNFTVTPETNSFALTLNSDVGYVVAYEWNFTNNAQASNSTGLQYLTVTAVSTVTPSPSSSVTYTSGPATSIFWFITFVAVLIVGAILGCLIPKGGIGIGLAFGLIGLIGTGYFIQSGVLIISQYTNVNTNVTYYTLMPIGLFITVPLIASILCIILPIASKHTWS